MKKTISILLSLLLVLGLAACVPVKASGKTAAEPIAKDNASTVTAEPATPAPTEVPAPTPEPTEPPFEVVIASANEKLAQVKSLHMDMEMNMAMTITIAMGEMKQSMPMDVRMTYSMDTTSDPNMARVDLALSSQEENLKGVIYVVHDGENTITYTSDDDGVTWKKNTNPTETQLPQAPNQTLDLFTAAGANIQLVGTEELDGKTVAIYAGTIDGKFLQQILESSGGAGEITEAIGADLSEEALADLSDIQVTVKIDKESGLPVRFTIDMADAMKDLMMAALVASMGGEVPEGIDVELDVAAMLIDMAMSNFDNVEPIEIPEAALNAPEL